MRMLETCIASVLLFVSICGRVSNGFTLPYVPPPPEVLAAEGIITPAFKPLAVPAGSPTISQAGWTVTVDSFQPGNEGIKAVDGNTATFWHTEWAPVLVPLPHTITIDMKAVYNIDGLSYLPRQDGSSNGNIGQHQIWVSTDGVNFGNPVAFGAWLDDNTLKAASFETIPARYIRIKALTEAGNRGPWASAAEINVYNAGGFTPPANGIGKWGPTINFPLVPVAAAVEPNTGQVLVWSAYSAKTFGGGVSGQTVTAVYDPVALTVTQRVVTNTGHDMFCPGIAVDVNGRVTVTGGDTSQKTSIFDPASNTWITGALMNIPRGYQAQATCSDGRIFVIGGSWNGGVGGKNGEIYSPRFNTWTLLPNCPVAPMLTADAQGVYRADNHGWLFGWKNGWVFQAGPSKAMNWYNTAGNGGQVGAGLRSNSADSMAGMAVMYDAVNGKILTTGGSPNYQGSQANSASFIVTIGTPGTTPTVTPFCCGMWFPRIFANAVVLPDGTVFITGGQSVGAPFSDAGSALTPELWDPNTLLFHKMQPNSIPRNYHSFAVLLQDATVLSGGGGLCDTCSTNHFDAQVYTPQYLLNADGSPATRPAINSVSTTSVTAGGTITVTTNSAITGLSLIRYSSTTHTVNTDQRRIPLTFTTTGTNTYNIAIPNDYGIAIPGYWMLFAINSAGRPSVAKTILIH